MRRVGRVVRRRVVWWEYIMGAGVVEFVICLMESPDKKKEKRVLTSRKRSMGMRRYILPSFYNS